MVTVEVLLSTYNGERHLDALLDSVFAQRGVGVRVLARDDGSTDATRARLETVGAERALRVIRGENVGPGASFFELLGAADPASPYVAFCDQDDVWLPDKLAAAVDRLGGDDRPAMYCGRQRLVDDELRPLGLSSLPRRGPAFANALVENIATGCTVVLNAAARERLVAARPTTSVLHDWWAYPLVSGLGRVEFDDEPHVLYRQHAGNVVGSQHVRWRNWLVRLRRHRQRGARRVLWEQAREARRLFGDELAPQRRRVLERFIDRVEGRVRSLAYAIRPDVFRQSPIDDLVMRALLAGRRI